MASRPLADPLPVVVIVESLILILAFVPVAKTALLPFAEVVILAFVTFAVDFVLQAIQH
ncbi:MAG: hypothetical protein ACLUTO_11950 [Anaerostipes sp.]